MKRFALLALSLILFGCGGSGPRRFKVDACKSNFLDEHKMSLKGSEAVDLEKPDKSINNANLKISSAEFFIFDRSRDIRVRLVQAIPEKVKDAEKTELPEYKIACASGKGISQEMSPFTLEIPVVDQLQVDTNGKSIFSTKIVTIDWRYRNTTKAMLEVHVSDSSEMKQGSLKAIYKSFKDVNQLYFFGNDQQVRNTMSLQQSSERNSSASSIDIRTTQVFKTAE